MASNDVDIEDCNKEDTEETLEYSLETQESKELQALKSIESDDGHGLGAEVGKGEEGEDEESSVKSRKTTEHTSPLNSPKNKKKMGVKQTTMDVFFKRSPSPSKRKDAVTAKEKHSNSNKMDDNAPIGNTDKVSSRNNSPERSVSPYQMSSGDEYEESWPKPWKQDDKKKTAPGKVVRRKRPKLWRKYSDKDTQAYREGYPGKKDNINLKKNQQFYMNEIPSRPNGDYIDNIHKKWLRDYELLEAHHGYIQWLFPIREHGMNFQAQDLQLHEAKAICGNEKAKERVLKSYELMLDFYGMKLENRETGEVGRARNWSSRFRHLNRSMHNYLRITRILKSLGELGYSHLQGPFVRFVLIEAIINQTLDNCVDSCVDYWIHTVKNDTERRALVDFAAEHIQDD